MIVFLTLKKMIKHVDSGKPLEHKNVTTSKKKKKKKKEAVDDIFLTLKRMIMKNM